MAENIKTAQVLSILPTEVTRANAAIAEVDSLKIQNISLQVGLNQANTQIATLQARVRELEAAVPPVVIPPVVVPPVVVPPVTGKTNIYVQGGKLLSKNGSPLVLRGIEAMYGPTADSNVTRFVSVNKTLGANATGPLFQPNQANVTSYRKLLEEARRNNLVVGLNFDHAGNGRANMKQPAVVALVNEYDNVFLQCEVEQGDNEDDDQWAVDAIAFVAELRAAGYRKQPIKVGSPLGGRQLKTPLARGRRVLDADPEKNLIFTWQAYWGIKTTGWHYQGDNGFAAGRPGLIAACKAVADSGLCFVVGLDYKDDIGDTGMDTLMAELEKHQTSYQYWALLVGDSYGNGMLSDSTNPNTLTTAGRLVTADFAKTSKPLDLGAR
jgi:hypothetical protein